MTVTGGMLHIKAERRQEENVVEEHYLRREIQHGICSRGTLPLPEGVIETDVIATSKDGILEIVVPKSGIEPAKKIAISKS